MIPVRGVDGKVVAVLGLGRSGLAAARALQAGGAEVLLWDDGAAAREKAEAEGFTCTDLLRRGGLDLPVRYPPHGGKGLGLIKKLM